MCMDSITFWKKYKILGKLSTHPSPNQTSTLTSYLGQNFGLGEGKVGSLLQSEQSLYLLVTFLIIV